MVAVVWLLGYMACNVEVLFADLTTDISCINSVRMIITIKRTSY